MRGDPHLAHRPLPRGCTFSPVVCIPATLIHHHRSSAALELSGSRAQRLSAHNQAQLINGYTASLDIITPHLAAVVETAGAPSEQPGPAWWLAALAGGAIVATWFLWSAGYRDSQARATAAAGASAPAMH